MSGLFILNKVGLFVPCRIILFLFQTAYQLTTGGKFLEAAERLHHILLSITLLAVESRQEITEVCFCVAVVVVAVVVVVIAVVVVVVVVAVVVVIVVVVLIIILLLLFSVFVIFLSI